MRKGRRTVLIVLTWFLPIMGGGILEAARPDSPSGVEQPVCLTVEVAWSFPSPSGGDAQGAPASEVELELSEGKILEAVAWPSGADPERLGDRLHRLGGGRSGRVRARVEIPIGSSLILRASGQTMRFPVASILEGPQRTPPQSPVEIVVERLPWDSIRVGFGEGIAGGADGVVAPGSRVPVIVGFPVVTPEPTRVVVSCSVLLRPASGGEPVWLTELREIVSTNATNPVTYALGVPIPAGERTYVLEFRARWEPLAPPEPGSLIGRLIRLGKRGTAVGSGTATRRVTLAAIGQTEPTATSKPDRLLEPDEVDLSRPRGNRPTASGRSPMLAPGLASWPLPEGAFVESSRGDMFRGWMTRVGAEVSRLGPANPSGLAWSAVGLKVGHPGRPHRLTVTVTGGQAAGLGVAVVGPGSGTGPGSGPGGLGQRPRVLLDACASGLPILPEGPAATYSWLVWPDSADPILVLVNRSATTMVQVGSVSLSEVPDPPPEPAMEVPAEPSARGLGLAFAGSDALDRFGLRVPNEPGLNDPLAASRRLGGYLAHAGASVVLLPESLADRDRRQALEGRVAEDVLGPDRLDVALRVLHRRKLAVWLELGLQDSLPGLPPPGTTEALAKGLTRIDRQGLPDGPSPAYQPLNPEVSEALRRKVAAASLRKAEAPVAGLLLRLGQGPTLPGGSDTGFDDTTFARFVREAFESGTARGLPGMDLADPSRFAARARFLAGAGRNPWLAWRSKQVGALYGDLASAAAEVSPGVVLAVVTPGLAEGPAGAEARRADLAGLDPSLAWRAVGLDLESWPTGPNAPVILRGVRLGPDPLAHDLATHPELDARLAAIPARRRGTLLLGHDDPEATTAPSLSALPMESGPEGDEPLGHALAALDSRWILLAGEAVAGHEERLRQFAKVFRALPSTVDPTSPPTQPFGVSARLHRDAGGTFVALANDTPYPVRVETLLAIPAGPITFDDIGRGARLKPTEDAAGHHLVLDLPPFGVVAVRVSSPEVKLVAVIPYPSEAVLTTLQARFDAISAQLTRLTQGGESGLSGPPNPGFEPEVTPAARVVSMSVGGTKPTAEDSPPAPTPAAGWQVFGGMGSRVAIDPEQRRSGLGSLRLDAPEPPTSAASDPFATGAQSSMVIRAWLRSEPPDAKVRLWIEGEAAGTPFRRVSELSAAAAWSERAVRVGDLPPGGLDSVRLRFELLTAGSLWIDDLSVTGASLTEPERRNARNALVAAIQAYREKRYADFSRLAGSRWASLPGGEAPVGEVLPPAARLGLSPGRPGEASALPQGRRLR